MCLMTSRFSNVAKMCIICQAQCFTCIETFNHHNNPIKQTLLSPLIFRLKKLRHRKAQWLVQGHTASKWEGWNLDVAKLGFFSNPIQFPPLVLVTRVIIVPSVSPCPGLVGSWLPTQMSGDITAHPTDQLHLWLSQVPSTSWQNIKK